MKLDTAMLTPSMRSAIGEAQRAEEMGFDALWTAETSHDPFLPLVLAAEHTTRIKLGTAIAVAFPRSPLVLAQIAWDLQELSGGRFILGLGTQVKGHNERRFGVKWEHPGPKLREMIQMIHAVWDCWQNGARPSFAGKFYNFTLMTPFFNAGPIPYPRPPIYIAGVNEYMCRLAGELCDGGEAASASAQVAVQVDIPDEGAQGYAAQIRTAISAGWRLHLRYYVPGRDEATERDVDPMRLHIVEGRPYLEAWCLRAEGMRLFRLDRVLSLEVLDVPAAPPDEAQPVDVDQGLFRPSPDDVPVVLELSAAGRWVAEYYPCESVADLEDGRLRVVLRTPDTGWVRRLALRLGEDGRVISPPSLVADIREAATAALANYVV